MPAWHCQGYITHHHLIADLRSSLCIFATDRIWGSYTSVNTWHIQQLWCAYYELLSKLLTLVVKAWMSLSIEEVRGSQLLLIKEAPSMAQMAQAEV